MDAYRRARELTHNQAEQRHLDQALVDELLLTIDPLVLGTGARLFGEGHGRVELELGDSVATRSGVIVGTYRPATG